VRRRLLLAAGLCAAAAAAVRAAAFHVPFVQKLDVHVLDRTIWLGGYRGWQLTGDLVQFFNPAPYAVLATAVVAGALVAGRGRAALAAVVLLAGSAVTTQLLKHALASQRPYPTIQYLPPASWPSGHTTAAVALALALVIVSPPRLRPAVAAAGALLSAATAFSLLVLGSHYPTDVAGGCLVAGTWACLAATLLPSAVRARLPQRLAAARGDVEAAGQDEQQVREPVQVAHALGVDGLAAGDRPPLRAPAHRAADVQLGGGGRAAGQHE
jgi:membrane-associated phospholipid phosphatase